MRNENRMSALFVVLEEPSYIRYNLYFRNSKKEIKSF